MPEVKKAAEAKDTRVKLYVPRGAQNDDPNLFISVNGVNYLLPKGQESMVPPHVKAEYERSIEAQRRLDATIDRLTSK